MSNSMSLSLAFSLSVSLNDFCVLLYNNIICSFAIFSYMFKYMLFNLFIIKGSSLLCDIT